MTQQEIEQLADELIAEVAAEWPDSPHASVTQENGKYVFVFVITYNGSDSIFCFNPKGAAIKIIEGIAGHLTEDLSDAVRPFSIKDSSKRRLRWMLSIARTHFTDSIGQMPIIANVAVSNAVLEQFTRDASKQNELIEIIIKGFGEKLRRRLVGKRARRPRAFSDFEAGTAILQLGGRPSQHQLAKALKTTPKTVLTWVREKGFNTLADFLDAYHAERGEKLQE